MQYIYTHPYLKCTPYHYEEIKKNKKWDNTHFAKKKKSPGLRVRPNIEENHMDHLAVKLRYYSKGR